MEFMTLNNGAVMPMLAYGACLVSKEECERCVLDAFEVGYRAIDTAQAYGNEEEVELKGRDRDGSKRLDIDGDVAAIVDQKR